MKFRRTTAINKLLRLTKRKRVVQGGTWAGKTFGIVACIIDYAAKHPNARCTVVGETIPAIKEGPLQDFVNIMHETKRFVPSRFNRNSLTYHFANGAKVQFKSFDSEGKAKTAGKRQLLFLNEANHIPFRIADTLMTRTDDIVWIDFNPDNEFWAHTEILPLADSEFLLLKYTDNEALPENILNDLNQKREKANTSEYWANWCRVYIDGEIGNLQGAVYTHWKEIDRLPDEARLERVGLDFGYTNDPTAAVAIYKWNGAYILDEAIYQTGLTNQEIAKLLTDRVPGATVIADSAEPKSIRELKRAGVRCLPSEKGRDSITNGIQVLQGVDIYVTKRSENIKDELRKYRWREDRDGNTLNVPVDAFNHAMDGMRYGICDLEVRPNRGKYVSL